MTRDRLVGIVSAVVAFASTLTLVYAGYRLPREANIVLTLVCIACTLRALIAVGKVQPDDNTGEMGELRPVMNGRGPSSFLNFFLDCLGFVLVVFLETVDDLKERGWLPEVRGIAFVLAFVCGAIAILKFPYWGLSFQFFSMIFVSSLGFFLVYLFSKKSGAELN